MLIITTSTKQVDFSVEWKGDFISVASQVMLSVVCKIKCARFTVAKSDRRSLVADCNQRPKNQAHAHFDHPVLDGLWIY